MRLWIEIGDRACAPSRRQRVMHLGRSTAECGDDAGAGDDHSPAHGSRLPFPEDDRCVDRKSTRLNSSHGSISYAVFCLKKKKKRGTEARCEQAAQHYATSTVLDV